MTLIFDSALKSAAILALAWIACLLLSRRSADLRHRIWLIAILVSAAVPFYSLIPSASIRIAAPAVALAAAPARAGNVLRAFPWLLSIYVAGAALVFLKLIAGILRVAQITRRAERRDGIRYSREISTPLTWARTIVLPEGSSNPVVIAHERAHIDRLDWTWQTLSRLVAALYWFNPLIWIAGAALRREAEHAVDDRVLSSGADPHEYAGHLLAVARNLTGPVPAASVAMVRTPALEHRVRAILDTTRPRFRASRIATCGIAILFAAVALPAFQDPTVHKIGEDGLTPPSVIKKVDPVYTPDARDARIQGTTALRLVIDENGVAQNIEVARSLDPGLDIAAIEAVSQWQFAPGKKDGKPVRVSAMIEINFRLQ